MTFLAAGWLALFVPFTAIAWLALRRGPVESITTTAAFLWADRVADAASRARSRPPPAWVWLALAALATAIVALAQPARRTLAADVTVVLDPAARLTLGENAPMAEMLDRLRADARDSILTFIVPGQPDARGPDDLRPTARDTAADVAATLARLRREGRDVVLLSDAAAFEPAADRAMVRPSRLRANVGIARLAARDVGTGVQVLVTVARGDRSIESTTLVIMSGPARAERSVRWTGDALAVDVVVALDEAGETIEASITAGDGYALDDRARLVREPSAGVRVAVVGAVPDAVARLADAIRTTRPPRAEAVVVTLGDRVDAAGAPGVVVATGEPIDEAGPLRRGDHVLLDGLSPDLFDGPIAGEMPAGFEAIAWRGDRPIVAVREGGARAAWVGLAAARPTPGWVAVVDAAIAWSAGGGSTWLGVKPDDVVARWRGVTIDDARVEASPGLYRDASGRLRAVNVGVAAAAATEDVGSLDAYFAARRRPVDRSVAGATAGVGAALAVAAAALAGVGRRRS